LLDKEILYDGEKQEITGKKIYNYDDNKNLYLIETMDNNSNLQNKTIYIYEDNILIKSENYNGKNIVKYTIFDYENNKISKKNEFDPTGKIIIIHEYLYDLNNDLIAIKDLSESGDKIGEKEFIYEENKLVLEKDYDRNKKLILSKKYIYNDRTINSIEFYSSSNEKIRIIEKIYLKIEGDINKFGFKSNFTDIF
jgi:hypothetical protein